MDTESEAPETPALIEVRALYKIFGPRPGEEPAHGDAGRPRADISEDGCTPAVVNATFEIRKRETFVIMGLSGSGKSRCCAANSNRLIEPTLRGHFRGRREHRELKAAACGSCAGRNLPWFSSTSACCPTAASSKTSNSVWKSRRSPRMSAAKGDGIHRNRRAGRLRRQRDRGAERRHAAARGPGPGAGDELEILLMDEAFSALDPSVTQMQDELAELQVALAQDRGLHHPRSGRSHKSSATALPSRRTA